MSDSTHHDLLARIERLNAIGVALSAEKDHQRLLETILLSVKEITGADGGTLYLMTEEQRLRFEILRNDSLKVAMGGTTGVPIQFPQLPLYKEDGSPNEQMVAAYAVLHDRTVNIPDAYCAEGFDFSGTRAFDQRTGYRSTSFLTIPMKNHRDEIIGVLQLINKIDPESGAVVPFSLTDQQLSESLASQAAVALTNKELIDSLQELFSSFIRLIADAIDRKSPYTGGHCRRVPELTMLIADAAARAGDGPLAAFTMNEDERKELEIAAWLHDCGKIITPEHVVDKSTKLEAIHDRIAEVETRFEVLKRDVEIAMLRERLAALEAGRPDLIAAGEERYREALAELEADREFIRTANLGGEFMTDEAQQRVRRIGARRWTDGGERPLLTDDEIYNLSIARGTLTAEERKIIQDHVVHTITMLEALPFPKTMRRVPEFAGGHHEQINGKGYPKGIAGEALSVQARAMAIADIFEALTAADRPYKKGKSLSEALKIMGFMRKDGHIDGELFDLFVRDKVYLGYAHEHLKPEQIDEVEPARLPGFGAGAA